MRDAERFGPELLRRLRISDFRYVEIEAKRRVLPEDAKEVREYLLKRKKVKHQKLSVFFDQYLDTPRMDVLKRGASLRLRYRREGTSVYLQYKGPGFHRDGLLFRSEFATEKLKRVLMEESHHDIVHFTHTTVQELLARHAHPAMWRAMLDHLGPKVLRSVSQGILICMYQKDKFEVDLGDAWLEPSLDRIFAFHVDARGLVPLSTFCEYENEIKADTLEDKLKHLDKLVEFDEALAKKFDLRVERLDKYHRSASFFLPKRRS